MLTIATMDEKPTASAKPALDDIARAKAAMANARKALEQYEIVHGCKSGREHWKLAIAFEKAAKIYLRLASKADGRRTRTDDAK